MNSKKRERAKILFFQYSNYSENDILKIKEIHHGYTNLSFLFVTKDKKKFQIRLGQNNEIVNRDNEINIINLLPYNYYLYMDKKGNAIKEWLEGINPKFIFNKKRIIKLLSDEIIKLHKINIKDAKLIKHDYFEYYKQSFEKSFPQYCKKYKEILNKHKNLKQVLSHNDINPMNFLYNRKDKKIILIDFEWARINNEYFDVANFFRETNLSCKWLEFMCNKMSLDYEIMKEFVFVSTFFAYQWTYAIAETKKSLAYRDQVLKKTKKFYEKLS